MSITPVHRWRERQPLISQTVQLRSRSRARIPILWYGGGTRIRVSEQVDRLALARCTTQVLRFLRYSWPIVLCILYNRLKIAFRPRCRWTQHQVLAKYVPLFLRFYTARLSWSKQCSTLISAVLNRYCSRDCCENKTS